MISNKEIRKELSRTLKSNARFHRDHDKNNKFELVYLRDIENSLKELAVIEKGEKKETYQRYGDEITVAKLGVISTGYIALVIRDDQTKEVITMFDSKIQFVLTSLIVQITNHALAIINLVESGLDNPGRALSRILDELVFLTIYLAYDLEKIDIYTDSLNQSQTWYNNFRIKNVLKVILEIEKEFGLPNDLIDLLKNRRQEAFSFYSEYVHHSFDASYTGAFIRDFDDNDQLNISLFGKTSIGSYSTLLNICDILLYFNMFMYKMLSSKYLYKSKSSNVLFRMAHATYECYNSVYFIVKRDDN